VTPPVSCFWQGKVVLCTGATGLVGGWLVSALLDMGADVVALVRNSDHRAEFLRSGAFRRVALVAGKLEDFGVLERAINQYEVDTVIHLAAQAIVTAAERSPLQTFESNIRGTYNLLEACRIHPELVERVVVASSDKAYGNNRGLPYTEDLPLRANHPYDVSKACADLLARTYAHTYGVPVAVARCGNIFGGGDMNWNRLVPGTIRALTHGEQPRIRSDGTYVRDYLYVKDAAAAYLVLAEQAACPGVRGEAFNFSAACPKTVLEVVECISELMGTQHLRPRILNEVRNEIPSQVLATDRAHERLDWRPKYHLAAGLRETIDWYRAFLADTDG
jgi:CDP-glucose 4,6-dehydratase